MRGNNIPKPELGLEDTESPTFIVKHKREGGLVAAHIVDPNDRSVQFLVISSTWVTIMAVVLVTLLLCGIIVLGMVTYNKGQIDDLQKRVPKLENTNEYR